MSAFVALLRGINVGGKNRVAMADLREAMESAGFANPRTYIQSGNVVFEHTGRAARKHEAALRELIAEVFGFEPRVLVISRAAFLSACENNPFPGAEVEPKTLHLFFLERAPKDPDEERLQALCKGERYVLSDAVFYLHSPGGFSDSKLAAGAEKALGVAATARNWRTVGKIREMLDHD